MAPPSSRRSGHSRRAQFTVFTGYVVAAIGGLIGAVLLGLSLWQPGNFGGLRGAASDAIEPAGQATASVRGGGGSVLDNMRAYIRAGSKNAALQEELALARIRLEEARAVEQENERLKALLALKESEIEPVAVTRMVGSTSTSARRFAYIGVGRNDGIEVGMPVRSPRGVVGRILEIAGSSARVLLITDSESVLPVRRAKDETVAFAEGRGDGLVRIRLVNLGINPIEPGDLFVTSGAGGYYRPGVAVAIATEVTNDGAIARVVANPAAADFVSVEPLFQPESVESSETPADVELGSGEAGA